MNEAKATITLQGASEDIDFKRREAERRREQAAYFSEKERIAAITKDNTKLFRRIEAVKPSIDNLNPMMM